MAQRAQRDAATTTAVRDFTLPCTSHHPQAALRAPRARQVRNARVLERLRAHLTIG
ncbi:hypothetical protein [Streptomyces bungoensis]|uniref:hypothetical protein n=1 Tax=Streptomyces bungoensis TaxID=285568 RepID=UPI00343FB24F